MVPEEDGKRLSGRSRKEEGPGCWTCTLTTQAGSAGAVASRVCIQEQYVPRHECVN